jgi:exonuclease SbcC
MTGGRIQLQLATRRETKAGKVAETLDIRISDEVGQRDYEMFSGGEAFRIDFALRIALSQLLAERSGASLATLIIDEGFGSQDQEGLDRLVDALVSIKDRFRLVLVITHIEDLKQRFDRRIDVIKDPERGSAAMIV